MATEKQLEANRRNAQRSTGPKTEAGKNRSRANAVTHGLTAETLLVLPEEDAGELAGRIEAWTRDLGVRDGVEECLIRRAAVLSWKLDRGDRHEAAVLTRKIRERAEVEEAEHRDRTFALTARLLPTLPDFERDGFDPMPAAELVRRIESTAEGCRWLLGCWDLLRRSIEGGRPWLHSDEMAVLRLSGHGPIEVEDPSALDLVVAGRIVMRPEDSPDADCWEDGPFQPELDHNGLRAACARRPSCLADARRILLAAVDRAVARLEVIRDLRDRDGDDWGAEESARIASFDPSVEGERLRRYQTANHREMIRSLESVAKLRLQAAKLDKEERPSAQRNEPNPAVEVEEPKGIEGIPSVREPRTLPEPAILRNEPNFDVDGVEWIEIPAFGASRETPPALLAAS